MLNSVLFNTGYQTEFQPLAIVIFFVIQMYRCITRFLSSKPKKEVDLLLPKAIVAIVFLL
jgi:hypothetical protein